MLDSTPTPLTQLLREAGSKVEDLILRPTSVAGTFEHDKEIVLGPRTAPADYKERAAGMRETMGCVLWFAGISINAGSRSQLMCGPRPLNARSDR